MVRSMRDREPVTSTVARILGPSGSSAIRVTSDGAISVIDLLVWATGSSRVDSIKSWRNLEEENRYTLAPQVRYVRIDLLYLDAVLDCEEAIKFLPGISNLTPEALALCARVMIPLLIPMVPRRRLLLEARFFFQRHDLDSDEEDEELFRALVLMTDQGYGYHLTDGDELYHI